MQYILLILIALLWLFCGLFLITGKHEVGEIWKAGGGLRFFFVVGSFLIAAGFLVTLWVVFSLIRFEGVL